MDAEFFTPLFSSQTPPKLRYFDGVSWKDSTSGKYADIISPVDGGLVGTIPVVTKDEIESAIGTAKKAQITWEQKPLHERVKIIHLTADWIRENEEYLTNLLMKEIGKTSGDAKSEILRTADLIDYYADEAVSFKGETLDSDNFPGFEKGRIAIIEKVAHGVVLAIAPFNYPVNLTASKLAPALLMGNSVVFKPPTMGSISALHLVQCFLKAGVPPGCLPALTGGGEEIGDLLTTHPDISMIAYTGSSKVGRQIAGKAGMIPLLFECGGNNSALVLPDADMGLTAREIVHFHTADRGVRRSNIF
jgi:glyceraldehyde-3-phosphate dehydrogenase (NADP+)